MKTRVITAAVGIPVVMACLLSANPWPWRVLLGVALVLGFQEGLRLLRGLVGFIGLVGYLVVPIIALAWLQQQGHTAPSWTPSFAFFAIIPLWVGDSAAYFVGRAYGRHKLAPSISPNKTWEGAIANLVGCVAACAGLGYWLGVPLGLWIACGIATGILGQAGDLFESWLKRRADVKDSGALLPGHGGILDRIDSLLFCAPAVAAIFYFFSPVIR